MDSRLSFLPNMVVDFLFYGSYILIAIIPIFRNDKMVSKKPISHKNILIRFCLRIRAIKKWGWIFIFAIIASALLTWVKSNRDKQDEKDNYAIQLKIIDSNDAVRLKYIDSISKLNTNILALEYGKQSGITQGKVDSVKGLLKSKEFQFDTLSIRLQNANRQNEKMQKTFNSPVIDFNREINTNPIISLDTNNKRYGFNVFLKNTGHGRAISVHYHFTVIALVKNIFLPVDNTSGTYSQSTDVIEENIPLPNPMYIIGKNFNLFENLDSLGKLYISLEVTYKNVFEEECKPFQKSFYLNVKYINKDIPIVPDVECDKLNKYLINNKYWENFNK